jgi:peptide methionine sulfoxide reductase MsrA
VTSIEPLEAFYAADQSHQNYFERNPVCARSVEGEVGAGGVADSAAGPRTLGTRW